MKLTSNIQSVIQKIDIVIPKLSKVCSDVYAKVFFENITKHWAVDTGYSRSRWQIKLSSTSIKVVNDAFYSPILWKGRYFDGKQFRGSNQMPEGGLVILLNSIIMARELCKTKGFKGLKG